MPSTATLLRETPVYALADTVVRLAREQARHPVALYVVDVGGQWLRRVAGGDGQLPEELPIPRAIGPELPVRQARDLAAGMGGDLVLEPLWLRHRAVAALLSAGPPATSLEPLAREAAAALELADGYTDLLARARRRRPMTAASELQENLLPPRIAGVRGAELAGSILPAYEVGGDWFDLTETDRGAWLALADMAGKGSRAAAMAALGLGAQRAARRNGATLEDAARAMHEALSSVGDAELYMTALLAEWDAAESRFGWLACGHPAPLLVPAGGSEARELRGARTLPLGVDGAPHGLRRNSCTLSADDRVVLYSDGISERIREDGGRFGVEGIRQTVLTAGSPSATSVAAALHEAVCAAARGALQDDATVLVLHVLPDSAHEPPAP